MAVEELGSGRQMVLGFGCDGWEMAGTEVE